MGALILLTSLLCVAALVLAFQGMKAAAKGDSQTAFDNFLLIVLVLFFACVFAGVILGVA